MDPSADSLTHFPWFLRGSHLWANKTNDQEGAMAAILVEKWQKNWKHLKFFYFEELLLQQFYSNVERQKSTPPP